MYNYSLLNSLTKKHRSYHCSQITDHKTIKQLNNQFSVAPSGLYWYCIRIEGVDTPSCVLSPFQGLPEA